jgi:glutamine amidotransferase PdxT
MGAALRRIGAKGVEVRKPEQLLGLDSLIIPGGESTTMAKLANYHNLVRGNSVFSRQLVVQSSLFV